MCVEVVVCNMLFLDTMYIMETKANRIQIGARLPALVASDPQLCLSRLCAASRQLFI